MHITELSIRRPVTTFMVFLCFLVIGIIASRLLPLEFFPDIDFPYIGIDIPYPGSTPEEVEQEITRPVEEVLATIGDIKQMTSRSRENGAYIGLRFHWGMDANIKALEVKEKIDGIRHLLPADIERFYIRKYSATDMEMLTLRISSNRDLSNGYDLLDRNIKRRIERIEGVSKVELYGVEKKEIHIQLDVDRLIAHKIDIGQLTQTLRQSNFLVTAGKITDHNQRYIVRPIGEIQEIEEIDEIIIGKHGIRLGDVAEVIYDKPEQHYGRHLNRKYAIGLDVFKEAGANTVEVNDRIINEIEHIKKNPEMEGIHIYYMSSLAEGIVTSLNELLKAGLLGGLLAFFVLFFFLRRLSSTLIVALAVPFSIYITMAVMYFFGFSLNILSMMGLMLAVGMLVDNAVVVTENINRHQLQNSNRYESVIRGVKEVSLAITAGTMTTAIVFLPNILSPKDETSVYLKHVAITICIALAISLILAQTIVPLVALKLPVTKVKKKKTIIDQIILIYEKTLKWTLKHRWATAGIIAAIFILSLIIPFFQVKTEMFDEPQDRRFRLHYHINGQYALEKVENAVNIYEKYLFENQERFEIESVYSYYEHGYASSTIILKKGKEAKKSMKDIQEEIRIRLPRVAIANPSFEREGTGGREESVQIQLIGRSSEKLVELSHDVARIVSRINGLVDVRSDAEAGDEEVHVVIDRHRARQVGFTVREIANVVSAAMRGINLRRFRDESGEIEMLLEFQEDDKQTLDDLQNIPLYNDKGQTIQLASIAEFRVKRGPRTIRREDRITSLNVKANLQGITINEAKNQIKQILDDFNFPAGYSWNYGERFDYEKEAMNTMLFNILLALILIYFIMASLFESLLFPASVWTQIIFAVFGVYWFFMITGTKMTIMGMIGILILIGVVVNNGIVLIDHVNQLRIRGYARHNAIIQAGKDRIRPILMTAGTTVLSLIPLCIVTTQIGGNGPPYFPMARAIVGGLSFSTLVTLLILPTIYTTLDDLRNWTRKIIYMAKATQMKPHS